MAKLDVAWGEPEYLYRAFGEMKYAIEFVKEGKMRMRHIMYYANIVEADKPSAMDDQEGVGRYSKYEDGELTETGSVGSRYPVYILSLSGSEVDRDHLCEHGDHVVRINEPRCFVEDLAEYMNASFCIDCVKIHYEDEPAVRKNPEGAERLRITYSQKRLKFSLDHEYRVAVVSTEQGRGCEGIEIDMNRPLPYAEIL